MQAYMYPHPAAVERPLDHAMEHMAFYPPPLPGVRVTLQQPELWQKFHGEGNEMIITKKGRRMFPKLKVRVSGLEPDALYCVVLEMRLSAPSRFKYSGGRWVAAGAADAQSPHRVFVHPDSPATGATWSARDIDFSRPKPNGAYLTNNTIDVPTNNMVLTSMHKYLPYIHVVRTSDKMALQCSPSAAFAFPETEFVAVTAYQNEVITKMKINHNPFAKGFRETGMSKCRRKQEREKMLMGAREELGGAFACPSPPMSDSEQGSNLCASPPSPSSSSPSSSPSPRPSSPPFSLPATPPPELSPASTNTATLTTPTSSKPAPFWSIDEILDPNYRPHRKNCKGTPAACPAASTTASAATSVPLASVPVPSSVPAYPDTWLDSQHYSHYAPSVPHLVYHPHVMYSHAVFPSYHPGHPGHHAHPYAYLPSPPMPDSEEESGAIDLRVGEPEADIKDLRWKE